MDSRCLVCHSAEEDGRHLFVKCGAVKEGRKLLQLEDDWMIFQSYSSATDVIRAIWKLSEQQQLLIIVFCWLWWDNRNKLREGERALSVEELCFRANCYEIFKP